MNFKLYASPNTYAMTSHAILEELGVLYDIEWVELFTGSNQGKFSSASPMSRVPALETDDGTICDSQAIALYLAEMHEGTERQERLEIEKNSQLRGQYFQWMSFLSSSLQPDVLIIFHPEFYFADQERQNLLMEAARIRMHKTLSVIEKALIKGPYFFGNKLTVVDFCLAMQTVWPEVLTKEGNNFPNIRRHLKSMLCLESVKNVLEVHKNFK